MRIGEMKAKSNLILDVSKPKKLRADFFALLKKQCGLCERK